jgi:hypothetical protein
MPLLQHDPELCCLQKQDLLLPPHRLAAVIIHLLPRQQLHCLQGCLQAQVLSHGCPVLLLLLVVWRWWQGGGSVLPALSRLTPTLQQGQDLLPPPHRLVTPHAAVACAGALPARS